MSDATARVGLVGYGLGGSAFHAPLIDADPRLRLDAIVTRDPQRRAAATERYPAARLVDDVDALLAGSDGLDLVVVTTPNRFHVPVALAAIEAGLHVVVDKPVAPSAAEARTVGEAAAAAGVIAVPFHNRRWDGDFLTVRSLVAGGKLGTVRRFESRFERWRPEAAAGSTEGGSGGEPAPTRDDVPREAGGPPIDWKDDPDPAAAGGTLFDLGSHLVDQALVLLGRPTHVHAEVDIRRAGVRTDDDAFIALSFDGGVHAHLWASAVAPLLGPRFRVLGSRAGYVSWGLDGQESALRSGAVPGGASWGHGLASTHATFGTDDGHEEIENLPGDYPAFYAGVAAAVLEAAPPPVAWDDAVAVIRVLEAARAAAAG